MKLGTENRTKTIAAVVLLALGVVLFVRMLQTPAPRVAATSTASSAPTEPTAPARNVVRDQKKYVAAALTQTLDPRLRLDLLKDSEDVQYQGAGRNIFAERAVQIERPVASPCKDKNCGPGGEQIAENPGPQLPPGPPPPPPIDLKFYGWASKPGEPKKIFLSRGEDVFVAGEGEIVARRYKVLKIGPNSVEIEDLLSNNRQSIPLQG